MIYKKICSRCKSTENLMPGPYSKRVRKDGETVSYFRCNPCNTAQYKRYRSTARGRLAGYRAQRKQYEINGNKWRARSRLSYHLRKNHITRPTSCSKCHVSCIPDGHHSDYAKALDVEWLCRQCHSLFHRQSTSVML